MSNTLHPVIQDFHDASALCAQLELVSEIMSDMKRRYVELNARVTVASSIKAVVGGVPLDRPLKDDDARTLFHLIDSDQPDRSFHLYETVSRTGWCVRINEHLSSGDRWSGGNVLGLGKGWVRSEAQAVAREWIIRRNIKENGIFDD